MTTGNQSSSDLRRAASLYAFATTIEVATGDDRIALCVARFGDRSTKDRPHVLLLHGNPSNLDDWRVLAPLLGENCEIVAVDLPGFGKSEPVPRRADESRLDASARVVVALADALGWREPFFVMGHSHGAAVAQIVAADYSDRVAAVVLIATLGSPAHPAYRLLAFPGVAGALAILAKLLRSSWFVPLFRLSLAQIMRPIFHPARISNEQVDRRLREFVERPQILVSMADVACGSPSGRLLSNAEKIRTRALFLHGAEDRLIPVAYARRLHAAIEKASFHVVSGAGHMAHVTHASQVSGQVRKWIFFPQEDETRTAL